jgi:hypothetical protein
MFRSRRAAVPPALALTFLRSVAVVKDGTDAFSKIETYP